jgi:phosphate transport system substrate-binding protein
MLSVQLRRWVGASALVGALLLSACGEAATPATGVAPTATAGATGAATATGSAPAAPTNTPIEVGNPNASLLINGAGATFPVPIYTKWFQTYATVDPTVRFNYQPIGSGAGIQQIQNQTVDFGGSDAPLTDAQLAGAKGGALYHIPTVAGSVAVIYNLNGAAKGLKLDGETLAKIFDGSITAWNDPAITGQNAEMAANLKGDIAVVHRSDGSGTTNIFTDYLSTVSADWKAKVGKGTSVNWPVGLGGRGNAGVAGLVQQTPGGIGYVELAYAVQNKLPYASVKNAAGEFVEPTLESTGLAAEGVSNVPDDLRLSIVNSSKSGAYPIAGFTYILVYKTQTNAAKGAGVAKFLWWAIHDGEAQAKTLDYAPLPASVVTLAETKIKALDCGGSPCYK